MDDFIDSLFGGGQAAGFGDLANQIQQGQGAINQYYQQGIGYMNPYYQAGLGNLGKYQSALGQLADPTDYYNKVMSGYQESPGTKFQLQNALNAVNARAAATGMGGSSSNLDDVAKVTQGLINQGQQQYFGNISGLNRQYLGGLGGLEQQGFGAAQGMGQLSAEQGNALANLYQNLGMAQAGQDEAESKGLTNFLGQFLPSFF